MEAYLEKLLSQIRCKKARPFISEEIKRHIEDQIAENLTEGMDAKTAEERLSALKVVSYVPAAAITTVTSMPVSIVYNFANFFHASSYSGLKLR